MRHNPRYTEAVPNFLLEKSEVTLRQEVDLLESRDILISSCHAPFGGENDLSLLDEDARLQALTRTVLAMQRGAAAGATRIVVHPPGALEEGQAWGLVANDRTHGRWFPVPWRAWFGD